jgi:uncharacterized protein YciI
MKSGVLFLLSLILSPVLAQPTDGMVFTFLNTNPNREHISSQRAEELQAGHMANITRLANEGHLIAAGPFVGGGGMFVFNTASISQAEQWLATDPAVAAQRYRIENMPFTVTYGGICKSPEPYEMVTYSFIRFHPEYNKFNVRIAEEHWRKHLEFIAQLERTGNVLLAGTFGPTEGGIVVMQGEIDPEIFQINPAVADGFLIPELRRLWVSKGSFCE